MTPLPKPDWGRPDSEWVLRHDGDWEAEAYGPCDDKRCGRNAVARRRDGRAQSCEEHLASVGIWIADGIPMYWRLVSFEEASR